MENKIGLKSPIDKWLHKQATREENVPKLIDVLLKNRVLPYIIYRLKYFSVRVASDLLVTIVEFSFFFYLLDRSYLKAVVSIKILTLLSRSWIWGALELPRSRIRDLYWEGRRKKVAIEIRSWISLSIIFSITALGMSAAYLIGQFFSPQGITYIALYIFSCFVAIGLDLFVRTYHSCVYAIRRIYRPMLFMIVPNMVYFLITIILWKIIGLWTFGITGIITSLISCSITFYFAKQAMKSLKLPQDKVKGSNKLPLIKLKDSLYSLMNAFSFAFIKVEYLVILFLIRSGSENSQFINFSLLFFLISPFFSASSDWTRLFYFDYKRLEVGLFSNFRSQINSYLNKTSFVLGLLFWTLSAFGAYFILKIHDLGSFTLLLLLFLFASILSNYQMRAFSNSEYVKLLISEVVFIICAGFFIYTKFMGLSPLLYLSISQACGLIFLLLLDIKAIRIWTEKRVYSFTEWLSLVSKVQVNCRIGLIEFNGIEGQKRLIQKNAILLKRILRRTGVVSCLNDKTLTWMEKANSRPLKKEDLVILFSGTIGKIIISSFKESGKEALQGINLDLSPSKKDEDELLNKFNYYFPMGEIISIGKNNDSGFGNLKAYERKIILKMAIRFSNGIINDLSKFRYHVSTFSPKGELRYIFLINRKTNIYKINDWLNLLKSVNYSHSLSPL